ncbi:hypothetical protein B0T17DRAFT_224630 [Bombardia bombarda]|uniref:Transmembrane protein n=1 Tax=Bombardia bombarda TaxID=252184 RepID=A0AA39XAY3_9PEZI|nr:hypothetical protein B0T17DRAFT_224630 [Bombardia bombarda]
MGREGDALPLRARPPGIVHGGVERRNDFELVFPYISFLFWYLSPSFLFVFSFAAIFSIPRSLPVYLSTYLPLPFHILLVLFLVRLLQKKSLLHLCVFPIIFWLSEMAVKWFCSLLHTLELHVGLVSWLGMACKMVYAITVMGGILGGQMIIGRGRLIDLN